MVRHVGVGAVPFFLAPLVIISLLGAACASDDPERAIDRAADETPSVADADADNSAAETEPTDTTADSPPTAPPVDPTPAPIEPVTIVAATGGNGPTLVAAQDLAEAGYVEEEFLFSGEAAAYAMVGERTPDGQWDAAATDTAPFTSRLVVRRPAEAADFSGVVIVEWINVSSGTDREPGWGQLYEEILREGHAWVGVSAQAVTLVGGDSGLAGGVEGGLVLSDPTRYGDLNHPGDAWSYDIFTQAGRALVTSAGPAPLGPLAPRLILAGGESQAAFFLTTYLNAVHPLARFYDGFLVHSRGGSSPLLEGGDLRSDDSPVRIRTDLTEPVMIFETETDLITLRYIEARQDDTSNLRTWEVAGTAHADAWSIASAGGLVRSTSLGNFIGCTTPINDGPQHEVIQAALSHLVGWAGGGPPPPIALRLGTVEVAGAPAIARDADGNALGGVRTPVLDVAIAAYSGDPVSGGGQGPFCFLFGSTRPFEPDELARYESADDYLTQFATAADAAVDAGFLLRPDADTMMATATAAAADLAFG